MTDPVEEEEFGDDKGFDQHDGAGGDDGQKSDDVHDPEGIEDYVAWACQGAFKERHGVLSGFGINEGGVRRNGLLPKLGGFKGERLKVPKDFKVLI